MTLEQVPLAGYDSVSDENMVERAKSFLDMVRTRRSVRQFSTVTIPHQVIVDCIKAAATAPSGANQQPWHFVVVADVAVKRKIREAAEQEELAFYGGRVPDDWLEAVAPLGTDANKPFLEEAPFLIVVFQQVYQLDHSGGTTKNYYVQESVGIATGILLTALHHAGLATLTHTPSPMKFLQKLLRRPVNERATMIIVVGHPAAEATVPKITRKPFDEVCSESSNV